MSRKFSGKLSFLFAHQTTCPYRLVKKFLGLFSFQANSIWINDMMESVVAEIGSSCEAKRLVISTERN